MASVNQPVIDLGNVMVIGGNGFLGHHIIAQLLDSPRWSTSSVTGVDLRCTRNRIEGAEYSECDITDAAKLLTVMEAVRPDVVIHTASPAAQGDSDVHKNLFKKVNVDGTACVIEVCQKAGVKALVYTSSASILSDNVSDLLNVNEEWPVIRGAAQSSYYSETKAEAEALVLAANRAAPSKLLTCSIRPSGIFGEADGMTTKHTVQIYRDGRTNVQVGDNNNLFDFTYVGNVAHAHLLAARLLLATAASTTIPLDTERVDGEAFLITNDEPIYFWDFCRAIWNAAGSTKGTEHVWGLPRGVGLLMGYASEVIFSILRKPPTFNRQRIIYSTMTRYFNISKAKYRLRYSPIVSLDEGIKRAVAWSLANDHKSPN
ncbi:Sterol-4-alpha-carboxylate 3-dehydrogenase, decarboxylating [Ceratocystis lukuohia]|uniref:Sterol-4-alpha-carboxylate 3-dehydrogenase, decarboxylating n=1 Tax=Ceratocystis lukuohia TaxID=2019550 RepID=A0ABR4MUI6_9PEZI